MSTNKKIVLGLLLWWLWSRKKESTGVTFDYTEPGFEDFSGSV